MRQLLDSPSHPKGPHGETMLKTADGLRLGGTAAAAGTRDGSALDVDGIDQLMGLIEMDVISSLRRRVDMAESQRNAAMADAAKWGSQVQDLTRIVVERDRNLADVQESWSQRLAEETVIVHGQYEDKLMERDALIDDLRKHTDELERTIMSLRQHRRGADAASQAGESGIISATERDGMQREVDALREHYESLLAVERTALSTQKRLWEDISKSKLTMELDACSLQHQQERIRWASEKTRLEQLRTDEAMRCDELTAQVAELEKTLTQVRTSWEAERESSQRTSASMAALRQQMEQKLEECIARHREELQQAHDEFKRALSEQSSLYDSMVDERTQAKRQSDEELALLRADRSRMIGDHRSELKEVQQRLLETQTELTKRIDHMASLQDTCARLERRCAEVEQVADSKCKEWEQLAADATRERAALAAKLRDLELQHKREVQAAIKEHEDTSAARQAQLLDAYEKDVAGLQQEYEETLEKQARESDAMRQHYENALARAAKTAAEFDSSRNHWELSAAQKDDRVQELQRTLSVLQSTCAEMEASAMRWRSRYEAAHHDLLQQSRAVAYTKQQVTHTDTQTDDSRDGSSPMRMNQLVWSLQQQLHESQQEIEFLTNVVQELEQRRTTMDATNGGRDMDRVGRDSASPLRDADTEEARVLLSYFSEQEPPTRDF